MNILAPGFRCIVARSTFLGYVVAIKDENESMTIRLVSGGGNDEFE